MRLRVIIIIILKPESVGWLIKRFDLLELRLMFRLMDRVTDGISPMLKCLEDHIINAGLADMMLAAELITQVNKNCNSFQLWEGYKLFNLYFRILKSMWNDYCHCLTNLVN